MKTMKVMKRETKKMKTVLMLRRKIRMQLTKLKDLMKMVIMSSVALKSILQIKEMQLIMTYGLMKMKKK